MTRPARPACIRFLPHRRKSFAQYIDGRDVGKYRHHGPDSPPRRRSIGTAAPLHHRDGGPARYQNSDTRRPQAAAGRRPHRRPQKRPTGGNGRFSRVNRTSIVPVARGGWRRRATARRGAIGPFPGDEVVSFNAFPGRVHHQGHHYITSRPQSTSSHLLLYTLTLSSSPATKLLGSLGLAAAAGRPGVAGHDFPSTAARRAGSATSETVPGRRRQGSAGAPRPDAVDHQQLNTTG